MKRKEFFELWIKALRSGEYKQGKEYLFNDGKYCCLGVACDLANKLGVRKLEIGEGNEQVLPDKMISFMGIDALGQFKNVITYRGKSYNGLSELNDGGVTFKTIARIIEEQLEAGNFKRS